MLPWAHVGKERFVRAQVEDAFKEGGKGESVILAVYFVTEVHADEQVVDETAVKALVLFLQLTLTPVKQQHRLLHERLLRLEHLKVGLQNTKESENLVEVIDTSNSKASEDDGDLSLSLGA